MAEARTLPSGENASDRLGERACPFHDSFFLALAASHKVISTAPDWSSAVARVMPLAVIARLRATLTGMRRLVAPGAADGSAPLRQPGKSQTWTGSPSWPVASRLPLWEKAAAVAMPRGSSSTADGAEEAVFVSVRFSAVFTPKYTRPSGDTRAKSPRSRFTPEKVARPGSFPAAKSHEVSNHSGFVLVPT